MVVAMVEEAVFCNGGGEELMVFYGQHSDVGSECVVVLLVMWFTILFLSFPICCFPLLFCLPPPHFYVLPLYL